VCRRRPGGIAAHLTFLAPAVPGNGQCPPPPPGCTIPLPELMLADAVMPMAAITLWFLITSITVAVS
jgi:hypothetical protein